MKTNPNALAWCLIIIGIGLPERVPDGIGASLILGGFALIAITLITTLWSLLFGSRSR
ncbi:hypothetical protein AGMMS49960_06980 [Betaproteobacteria bacterium]|nr:hypothetical protein AGMMS49960_06980 [Betaproteobacteria bacterium]GHU22625.1 hypothetical protein AGMMS50243_22580 [Betaproteobacteria bacterium]